MISDQSLLLSTTVLNDVTRSLMQVLTACITACVAIYGTHTRYGDVLVG